MKISIKSIEADVYILLWMLYYMSKIYGVTGIFQSLVLVILYGWSLICAYKIHSRTNISNFIKSFDVLLLMFSIYGIFLILQGSHIVSSKFGNIKNTLYLINIYTSLLPLYPFYWYSLKGSISIRKIVYWIIPFFTLSIAYYYYQQQLAIEQFVFSIDEEIVNNNSYAVLGLVPLIAFMEKRIVQLTLFLICIFIILSSFKRGPIIIVFACFLYFFLFTSKSKGYSKYYFFIVAGLVLYYCIDLLQAYFAESDMFQYKFYKTLELNSSGRDSIIGNMIDYYINKANLFQLIFGSGAYATVIYTGNMAHNDWVEVLINQGLVGVLVYFVFIYQLFIIRMKTPERSNYKLAISFFLIIFIFTSLFSMAYSEIPYYEMLVVAFVAASEHKNRHILPIIG